MCKLVNIRKSPCDVNICRPSKWGNPYSHLNVSSAKYKVDTVEDAVKAYEAYLLSNQELMESLHELKYKTIGCVCGTRSPCHGKVLKKYVDQLERKDEFDDIISGKFS